MKAQKKIAWEKQKSLDPKIEREAIRAGKATLVDNRLSTITQLKLQQTMNNEVAPLQRKTNNTGLPGNLKSGIENLSGFAMDDVKVHYNSSKPAQLQAHAYAQGTDIHLASGQEKHLPHEAWHVVQQKQGRVQPTRQLKSKIGINDDAGLEREADVMGAKALQTNLGGKAASSSLIDNAFSNAPIQRYKKLRDRDYRIEGEDDSTFTAVQSEEIRAHENFHYERKELEETEPEATMSEEIEPDKKKKNKKINLKDFNNFSMERLPIGIADDTYTGEPEFKIERDYFGINRRRDAKMRISDDETVAINDIPGYPSKDFYATDHVLEHANEGLEAVGSKVKLIKIEGAKIRLKSSNTTLTKIVPKLVDSDDETDAIAALQLSVCIEVASAIMGNQKNPYNHTLFLKDKKLPERLRTDHYFGNQKILEKIRKKVKKPGGERKVGANQFVNPEVGQGYGTFSVLDKKSTEGPTRWGYHFGAVVAKSGDGKDNITLENINRNKSVEPIMWDIVAHIKGKFAEELEHFEFEGEDLDSSEQYSQLKKFLLNVNIGTATAMHNKTKNSLDMSEAWYFMLYGTDNGQDFHSQQVESEHFANPMTLTVGKHRRAPNKSRFPFNLL